MPPIRGLESLTLTRHRNIVVSDDRSLRRAAARGEMTRLAIGAYVPTAIWLAMSKEDRHRLAAAAASEMNASFVASHRSAAAMLGIPLLGTGDGLVHTRVTVAAGTRTERGYRKHAVSDLELHVVEVDGVRTTSLERTVIDIAMTESFECGVVAADWALRNGATKASLRTALDELAPGRRRGRVESVIDFADEASGSVGESYSRVQIERSGFPRPLLQARFDDHLGLIGFVDFFWPDFRLIGEFDGFEKYSRQLYLAGRVPSEVVTGRVRTTGRPKAPGVGASGRGGAPGGPRRAAAGGRSSSRGRRSPRASARSSRAGARSRTAP
jgi:hypothetical protein